MFSIPLIHQRWSLWSYLHVGTGGQGGRKHGASSNWQDNCPGHVTEVQGSLHLHSGHPRGSSSKPSGHSIRQVWAAHGATFVQLTRPAAGALVPGTWEFKINIQIINKNITTLLARYLIMIKKLRPAFWLYSWPVCARNFSVAKLNNFNTVDASYNSLAFTTLTGIRVAHNSTPSTTHKSKLMKGFIFMRFINFYFLKDWSAVCLVI